VLLTYKYGTVARGTRIFFFHLRLKQSMYNLPCANFHETEMLNGILYGSVVTIPPHRNMNVEGADRRSFAPRSKLRLFVATIFRKPTNTLKHFYGRHLMYGTL
jgi:hypothetical protein